MIALNGSLPAEVSTAPPSGIAPCFRSSLKGPVPPRFLMAPETPWGEEEPPRDDVAIPSVDNYFNVLVEQIAFDDGDGRRDAHDDGAIRKSLSARGRP